MLSPAEIREQQAWRRMGLRDEEYERIVEILGRDPNYTELGMYAVLWSEHCAYKHTRPLFKLFPTEGEHVLQGPGENAGILDIGDGLGVVFKVESHNHPSAVEPYQGAATGVGGILRDIFTMGARPIAVLDSLRFGELSEPRQRYLFGGVVSGISGYGNCVGVPTVGGEVYFDPSYSGNCLVNVMAVGLVETKHIATARASGVGNPVMVVGSTTGRDGIHGASFASAELSEENEEKRPNVQVGDPFTEKLLIEACLEAIRSGDVVGIQDMGAAGVTSSAAEMATRAGNGIELDIALIPRREEGMTSYEIMLSESQERMLVVPQAGKEEAVREIFARWGLHAVTVGRVTDDGMLRVLENGRVVAEVPARSLSTDGAPTYQPEARPPADLAERQALDLSDLPEPEDYGEMLKALLDSPTLASKEWVYTQYDYQVQTNTVVGPGSDAAVLQVKGTKKGLALTIDGNGRYGYLDPWTGGAAAVCEAARNLVVSGAKPLGVTDGLNFGNPERPEVYWQIKEAIRGIAAACRALGIPVTGGNASLYNETNGEAIHPTPIIGMVGLLPDVAKRCPSTFSRAGQAILLLGETKEELGGSEYLWLRRRTVAGRAPEIDLAREKALLETVASAIERGLIQAAHDVSEGGLLVAVAEMCFGAEVGCGIMVDPPGRLDTYLFSESQGRVLVAVEPEDAPAVAAIADERGVPWTLLGATGGGTLRVMRAGEETAPVVNERVTELKRIWREAIPRRLEGRDRA
ncbi:MAG: phosphoribosylformylglycinamidine synthase subunit PurL [Bacillota bacterium]|nr:phosphoribosylformylglycinamidine synthase subunit PurL [Bacillota bacterium]